MENSETQTQSALVQERNQSLEFQPKNSTEKSACSLPLETETQIPLINPVNNEQQRKSGEDETTLFHQSSNEIQSVTTNKSNNDKNEIKQGDGNTLLQSKDCQQNQEEENVENEIPLSAILTSTDQKCVVCNQNLSTLSYLERENHVNSCLDFELSKPTLPPYRCSICGKDISNYNEARRQQHMNRCCDQSEVQTKSTNQNQNSEPQQITSEESFTYNSLVDAKWFCFVCKKDFSALKLKSRINHLKACAKKYKIGPKQLKLLQEEYVKQINTKHITQTTTTTTTTLPELAPMEVQSLTTKQLQAPSGSSTRGVGSDTVSSTAAPQSVKSKTKRTSKKKSAIMDVSSLGLSSPPKSNKTHRERHKTTSRTNKGGKKRQSTATTSAYFDPNKITLPNENIDHNDDFVTPISNKKRKREDDIKTEEEEEEDVMLALALSVSEAEQHEYRRSFGTENTLIKKTKQSQVQHNDSNKKEDTTTPPLPESSLPRKYTPSTNTSKKQNDKSEVVPMPSISNKEGLSLWHLQAIDTSDLSQSVFHTDIIPLSQRVSTKTKTKTKLSDQLLATSTTHNSAESVVFDTTADSTQVSSSKSSPASPLKLTQAIASPLPPSKTTSNSKDNISNSNLIELSQKKLQEQEDELNQMLDELEEGIQLSQPFERAFCRQTNHQNREASQEIEDRTDEWQQTSSIQSDAQHLNGKTANFRDTDQQLKQLSHSQSRNETSVSIISQVRVDKNSISNNSNQIMSDPQRVVERDAQRQVEDAIRLIEEQYQRRYIETLEMYRQKLSTLRNELYCEIGKLTLTKNRLVSRLRLQKKRNQQTDPRHDCSYHLLPQFDTESQTHLEDIHHLLDISVNNTNSEKTESSVRNLHPFRQLEASSTKQIQMK